MIGYNTIINNDDKRVLVTLEIPEDAFTDISRTSIIVKETAAYRTNKAKVTRITDDEGNEYESGTCFSNSHIIPHTVGELVEDPSYNVRNQKYSSCGIIFFLDKGAAETHDIDITTDTIKDGILTCYYKNGQKQSERMYKNGKPNGILQKWHNNGMKMIEGTFKDGKMDGLFLGWHNNGKKWFAGTYKDGEQDGEWMFWHTNGLRESEGTYKNGNRIGKWYYWNVNGEYYSASGCSIC